MSLFPGELKSKVISRLPFKSNSAENAIYVYTYMFLLFGHPVVSDSLWPHGLQDAMPLCTYIYIYIYVYIYMYIYVILYIIYRPLLKKIRVDEWMDGWREGRRERERQGNVDHINN